MKLTKLESEIVDTVITIRLDFVLEKDTDKEILSTIISNQIVSYCYDMFIPPKTFDNLQLKKKYNYEFVVK